MEIRFACTACGKCCAGWIPMNVADAVKYADHFPIGMVWTPLRATDPAFNHTARLFTTFRPAKGGQVALRIVPTAYMPPSLPCPKVTADGLCGIHHDKPLRCRTMPFFPYRDERQQDGMLAPRTGWACDVSEAAPVVYRDGRILDRTDFAQELTALRQDTPLIRRYAAKMLRDAPKLGEILTRTADIKGGNVILGFASLCAVAEGIDAADIARRQLPVLRDFQHRTANDPALAEYHARYRAWTEESAAPR